MNQFFYHSDSIQDHNACLEDFEKDAITVQIKIIEVQILEVKKKIEDKINEDKVVYIEEVKTSWDITYRGKRHPRHN